VSDALRNDAVLRQAYAALKDRLSAQHRTNRDAYTEAKSDFIRSVLHAGGAGAAWRKPVG
jgi:GrpB-like predicted nucleotidyltransferase (UPF0157 family)